MLKSIKGHTIRISLNVNFNRRVDLLLGVAAL